MKIVFLAAASSVHTVRWVNALSDAGVDVVLATQHDAQEVLRSSVRLHRLPHAGELGYFRNVAALKRLLAEERPDLLNAHYASGYGTTAGLSGFHPYLLSVWGSDVYDFPQKSPIHRWWMQHNLLAADLVASTSHVMADQARKVASGLTEIAITPFGVEMNRFTPVKGREPVPDGTITIGTVKTLGDKYGIDVFIRSIAILVQRLRDEECPLADCLVVRIVGDGPQRETLEALAKALGIREIIQFVGRVTYDHVPQELRKLDVYVALSRIESFGVAIIEAGACGLPVVVSDAGGLPEVVIDGETGLVVPREDPEAAAAALYKLVLDADLRSRMGQAARTHVASHYTWQDNVKQMIELYEWVIAGVQAESIG